jgi:DNA-directed RNA polymerase subunit M/transcription elongation factor TFIIS
MPEQTIVCPKCGARIPVSKAITLELNAKLRKTYDAEAKRREKEAKAAYEKRLAAEIGRIEKQSSKKAARRQRPNCPKCGAS